MGFIAHRNARKSLVLLGLISMMPLATAKAQLAHRYDINSSDTTTGAAGVTDSVGGANGTFVNPGSTASLTSTSLVTVNTNNTDFITLPSSIGAGITGDFSVEDWLTQSGSESAYTSIFSLSSSQANGMGLGGNFILLNPNRNGTGTTADFAQAGITGGGTGTETNVNAPGTNFKNAQGNFGTELQIVLTYVSATGVASIYNDGTLLASGNIGAGFSFQSATSGMYDAINGGDPYGDPDFQGATDDFRIYSSALTRSQISALESAGPNATNSQINAIVPVPEPASLMGLLGIGTLMGGRRLRRRRA
jgi:hypothetical protein